MIAPRSQTQGTFGLDTVRMTALKNLGIVEFINPDRQWTKYDTKALGDRARAAKQQMKEMLNYTMSDRVSDTQILHDLLDRLGVKVKQVQWSNKVEGHAGEKLRVYQVDPDCWRFLMGLIHRRHQEGFETLAFKGSPPVLIFNQFQGGDPPRELKPQVYTVPAPEEVLVDPEEGWYEFSAG